MRRRRRVCIGSIGRLLLLLLWPLEYQIDRHQTTGCIHDACDIYVYSRQSGHSVTRALIYTRNPAAELDGNEANNRAHASRSNGPCTERSLTIYIPRARRRNSYFAQRARALFFFFSSLSLSFSSRCLRFPARARAMQISSSWVKKLTNLFARRHWFHLLKNLSSLYTIFYYNIHRI